MIRHAVMFGWTAEEPKSKAAGGRRTQAAARAAAGDARLRRRTRPGAGRGNFEFAVRRTSTTSRDTRFTGTTRSTGRSSGSRSADSRRARRGPVRVLTRTSPRHSHYRAPRLPRACAACLDRTINGMITSGGPDRTQRRPVTVAKGVAKPGVSSNRAGTVSPAVPGVTAPSR